MQSGIVFWNDFNYSISIYEVVIKKMYYYLTVNETIQMTNIAQKEENIK